MCLLFFQNSHGETSCLQNCHRNLSSLLAQQSRRNKLLTKMPQKFVFSSCTIVMEKQVAYKNATEICLPFLQNSHGETSCLQTMPQKFVFSSCTIVMVKQVAYKKYQSLEDLTQARSLTFSQLSKFFPTGYSISCPPNNEYDSTKELARLLTLSGSWQGGFNFILFQNFTRNQTENYIF